MRHRRRRSTRDHPSRYSADRQRGLRATPEGQPTLFHPGDSFDTVPDGIDIIAVPAYGPWAAMKETIDFVRAVGALEGSRSTMSCSTTEAGLSFSTGSTR